MVKTMAYLLPMAPVWYRYGTGMAPVWHPPIGMSLPIVYDDQLAHGFLDGT